MRTFPHRNISLPKYGHIMQIKKVIAEIIRDELPGIVRSELKNLLSSELSQGSSPARPRNSRPRKASKSGVQVGQRWCGKKGHSVKAGRVIEIVALEKDKVVPKVISAPEKGRTRVAAKRISYHQLRAMYDLVE